MHNRDLKATIQWGNKKTLHFIEEGL